MSFSVNLLKQIIHCQAGIYQAEADRFCFTPKVVIILRKICFRVWVASLKVARLF